MVFNMNNQSSYPFEAQEPYSFLNLKHLPNLIRNEIQNIVSSKNNYQQIIKGFKDLLTLEKADLCPEAFAIYFTLLADAYLNDANSLPYQSLVEAGKFYNAAYAFIAKFCLNNDTNSQYRNYLVEVKMAGLENSYLTFCCQNKIKLKPTNEQDISSAINNNRTILANIRAKLEQTLSKQLNLPQQFTNPLIFNQVIDSEKSNKSTVSVGYSRTGLFRGHRQDNEVKQLISKALPANVKMGTALDTGDCFFDSIAQSLNSLGKGFFSAKDLRKLCHEYVVELDKKGKSNDNWIYQRFLADAKRLHPADEGEATQAATKSYLHYMANIQYTQAQIEKGEGLHCTTAIWGEQDIDGRILRKKLGIKLHVIELLQSKENLLIGHQLEGKSVAVDIDYTAQDMVHIIGFNNHFVPILPAALDELTSDRDSHQSTYTKKQGYPIEPQSRAKNEGIHEPQQIKNNEILANEYIFSFAKKITDELKKIFKKIFSQCLAMLEESPAMPYEVIGLGSMSRGEMTVYSDLEFSILVDNENIPIELEFIIELLQIRIINLGETPLNIEDFPNELKQTVEAIGLQKFDPISKGFCFDPSHKTPLGYKDYTYKNRSYKLICTPQQLINYVKKSKEWEKEGYFFTLLVSPVFLFGNGDYTKNHPLFEQYLLLLEEYMLGQEAESTILAILQSNLNQFKARLIYTTDFENYFRKRQAIPDRFLQDKEFTFSIKHHLYRILERILDGLYLYYLKKDNIKNKTDNETVFGKSCWEKVYFLEKNKRITQATAKDLLSALDIIIFYRAKECFYYKQQSVGTRFSSNDSQNPIVQDNAYRISHEEQQKLLTAYGIVRSFQTATQNFCQLLQQGIVKSEIPYSPEEIKDIKLIKSYRKQYRYAAAKTLYEDYIKLVGEDPKLLCSLAKIYSLLAEFSLLAEITVSVELIRSRSRELYQKAYKIAKIFKSAKSAFIEQQMKVIMANSKYGEGKIYYTYNNFAKLAAAKKCFKKALSLTNDSDILQLKYLTAYSAVLIKIGNWCPLEAEQYYNKALKKYKAAIDIYFKLGSWQQNKTYQYFQMLGYEDKKYYKTLEEQLDDTAYKKIIQQIHTYYYEKIHQYYCEKICEYICEYQSIEPKVVPADPYLILSINNENELGLVFLFAKLKNNLALTCELLSDKGNIIRYYEEFIEIIPSDENWQQKPRNYTCSIGIFYFNLASYHFDIYRNNNDNILQTFSPDARDFTDNLKNKVINKAQDKAICFYEKAINHYEKVNIACHPYVLFSHSRLEQLRPKNSDKIEQSTERGLEIYNTIAEVKYNGQFFKGARNSCTQTNFNLQQSSANHLSSQTNKL